MKKKIVYLIILALTVFFVRHSYLSFTKHQKENEILKKVVSRLEADSRVAEILVTGVNYDENLKKTQTTIKFLEYDVDQEPLKPRYFTFAGNIIQFQSLVIRFEDSLVRGGDSLKGKSAYIFLKVFLLDGKNTQEYEITPLSKIPEGYKLKGVDNPYEATLWEKFWRYALDPKRAKDLGIKNAQIEAPGTMFIPGNLYTIRIEHDGGLRIDVSQIPSILKGEKIIDL